jgi:hypothetical protein
MPTPETEHAGIIEELACRIVKLIPDHPEILLTHNPFDLQEIDGFECNDLQLSLAEARAAIRRAMTLWNLRKNDQKAAEPTGGQPTPETVEEAMREDGFVVPYTERAARVEPPATAEFGPKGGAKVVLSAYPTAYVRVELPLWGWLQTGDHETRKRNLPTMVLPLLKRLVEWFESYRPRKAPTADQRDAWILWQAWRSEERFGAIVCDPYPDDVKLLAEAGHLEMFGGQCVLESCPDSIREHIIDLHNNSLSK